MIDCEFVETDQPNVYVCALCGQSETSNQTPENTHRNCSIHVLDDINAGGAGTELHKSLNRFGFEITPDCRCAQRIKAMNERGTKWCRNNVRLIVDWLRQEAKHRNLSVLAMPGWRAIAKQLILKAIAKAERKNVR